MRPDDDVVGDHHEVVDLGAFPNVGAAKARPVDGRVRSDFHVVVDLDDAGLRNLDVPAAVELKSEAVATNYGPAMDDHAAANARALANRHMRINPALRPDDAAGADEDMRADDRVVLDPHAVLEERIRLNRHARAEPYSLAQNGGGGHPGLVRGRRRGEMLD